jgi:hypothetical protein
LPARTRAPWFHSPSGILPRGTGREGGRGETYRVTRWHKNLREILETSVRMDITDVNARCCCCSNERLGTRYLMTLRRSKMSGVFRGISRSRDSVRDIADSLLNYS